ncbi:MAG TPA: transcriptional regulator [Streptosporangiaceae bacterium]
MTTQRQPTGDLAIGVVGPHELVERIMLSGTPPTGTAPATSGGLAGGGQAGSGGGVARRLVAAAYRDEQEAADKVLRLGPVVDVCLFASPVPQEYARKAGVLAGPATCVPLNGSALYGALLRAVQAGSYDLAKVSVDVLNRADVEDAYAEFGFPSQHVHIREDIGSAATLAAFHERLWRRGEITAAFTCLNSVAERLSAAGVPAITVKPTNSAIRSGLRTATLLGSQRRLEEAQLALVVVEVPTLRDTQRRSAPRQSREELRLTVHRFLVQEAQRIQATVSPMGDYCFHVTATRGSLYPATDGFRVPPFTERARSGLSIALDVGVGMGRTAHEAEAHARAALGRSQSGQRAGMFALDREGRALVPAPRQPTLPAQHGRPKGIETLSRLADKLAGADAALVVDAEMAGRLLGVTPRTARRLLRTLVDEGLAWPLPPSRTPQPGRPRQFYRLIIEKLDRKPARQSTDGSPRP